MYNSINYRICDNSKLAPVIACFINFLLENINYEKSQNIDMC